MSVSKEFFFEKEIPIEPVGEGVKRQILGFDDKIMMVKVWFEEGGIGNIHAHPHSQTTYVVNGQFEVNIGGRIETLCGGDSFYIPPNVSHGAVCKKSGMLIDVFSPVREDFLTGGK